MEKLGNRITNLRDRKFRGEPLLIIPKVFKPLLVIPNMIVVIMMVTKVPASCVDDDLMI